MYFRLLKFLLLISIVISCENISQKKQLPSSNGAINSITIVCKDSLWEGHLKPILDSIFMQQHKGVTTPEPIFKTTHANPENFNKYLKKHRNVVYIEVKEKGAFSQKMKRNVFASPQLLLYVRANNKKQIKLYFREKAEEIISAFKASEIVKQQNFLKKNFKKTKTLKNWNLKLPEDYKIKRQEDDFVWTVKNIEKGSINIIAYSIDYTNLDAIKNKNHFIVNTRDSIGKKYLIGRKENMYMVTETLYTPDIKLMTIDNRTTIETRGLWKVKNFLMGGVFLNYIIEDKPNNRCIVLEGFVFAPSEPKRDYLFEVEAIIKSVSFLEHKNVN